MSGFQVQSLVSVVEDDRMWETGNRNVLLVSLNDKQKTWKSSLIHPRTDVGEVELVLHLLGGPGRDGLAQPPLVHLPLPSCPRFCLS